MKKIMIAFILSLGLALSFQTISAMAMKPTEDSEELRFQDMLMNLLTPSIRNVLDDYYRPSISKTFSPEITPWNIQVIETKRMNGFRSFILEITFDIEPTTAHNVSIGKDRLTFRISHNNSVELIKHTHLATYDFPPDLYNQ